MKLKTAELTGAQLDCWVARAEGYKHHGAIGLFEENPDKPWCLSRVNDWWEDPEGRYVCGPCTGFPHAYSTEWERGGPIIQRERIGIVLDDRDGKEWQADIGGWMSHDYIQGYPVQTGPTPLVAAMRAYVARKFGEEVELP